MDVTTQLIVNGTPRELLASAHELLLDALRERLGLPGEALRDVQVCGTCTALVDGQPAACAPTSPATRTGARC